MHDGGMMYQAFIFLLAAVISVPVAKRLGLGSVLGYLLAGVAIGPYVLKLVGQDVQSIMHFSEFGVVMMLFLVGLELRPQLLWQMRLPILGLGGLQVVVTSAVFCGIGIALGFAWQSALAVGLILSLSSTAIVLQSLNEKGLMPTEAGQSAFAVLLFQDIAVIPMLALLPLLALSTGAQTEVVADAAHHFGLTGWQHGLLVIGVVAAIIVGGRVVIRPLFRVVAETKLREIFTALALSLVMGIALLMEAVGLSAALGTFIAGVVLADNEYRHELEAEIEPFKGLLLGVFFISVGASIDFSVMMEQPYVIAGLVCLLVLVKLVVLFVLSKAFKLQQNNQWTFTFALAQGGEFCFVLFSFASSSHILSETIIAPMVVVVALSMAFTPMLMIVNDKIIQPMFTKKVSAAPEADVVDDGKTQVIIAGFGRFGQIIDRSLNLSGISTTVMENNPSQVQQLRKFGHKVFYGDMSRQDLLHSAGAGTADLLVIAINDHEQTKTIIRICKKHYPKLKLYARAVGRTEAHELLALGVDVFVRETFHSALHMSARVMTALGKDEDEAQRILTTFKKLDQKHIYDMPDFAGDEKAFISFAQKNKSELEKVMQSDYNDKTQRNDDKPAGATDA
jgi:monovalent cation:proton antiporter-2 (CPA2) family protein